MRKGLLGDLSSLVKTAKKLQELLQADEFVVSITEYTDEILRRSFKLVTRAVCFLDIWAHDRVQPSIELKDAGSNRPLTPPSDSIDHSVRPSGTANELAPVSPRAVTQEDNIGPRDESDCATVHPPRNVSRLSIACSTPDCPLSPPNGQAQSQAKRLSVTHRMSYTTNLQGAQRQKLASEQLNTAHDVFLGFIGSFIGLHLQSRSSGELIQTTRQSVIACRRLLAIVEEVWERDSRRSEHLEQARNVMHARLSELVQATKNMFSSCSLTPGEEVIKPESGRQLVFAATGCVRSAGECVSKTRAVIEKIGDFEFEREASSLSDQIFEEMSTSAAIATSPASSTETSPSNTTNEKPLPAPPSEEDGSTQIKPLPTVPLSLSRAEKDEPPQPLQPAFMESLTRTATNETAKSTIPLVGHIVTAHLPHSTSSEPSHSPVNTLHRQTTTSARTDSINTSVADSISTFQYSVRGDNASFFSHASTRATTPDRSPLKKQSCQTLTSSFGSASELRSLTSEDVAAVEEHVLSTTYAHELIYKDGQISGGSLPALVEQLTLHESAPDSVFVTTFYLTFRLFTTPVELAQCLIARFDYVGESPSVGTPVRLRVYNVFKGWLESHWIAESDSAALGIILSFATGKLRTALPAPGKRLAELTAKVTEVRAGALVPRLVSSGNSAAANPTFMATDSNVPNPHISKSQLNLLRTFKEGKSQCSILDFEPLELARQFTLIESKIFCAIQPEELLASEWTKKHDSKAVNIRAMSTLSTDLTNLVADTILNLEDVKKRALTIKQWVKIAEKCLELKNYDSLWAIMASLHSSMVLRLKRTWELVQPKIKARLEKLKAITDVSRNYAALRQELQSQMTPCLPFVGMYLTDLTFVEIGNSDTRQLPVEKGRESASVINFDKHMKTAKIISGLQAFQVPYRLAAVPEMQEWMEAQIQRVRSSDTANIQSQYRRSLILEPKTPVKTAATASPVDSTANNPLPTEQRNSSKDKFDFFNFNFMAPNSSKDR